TEESRSGEELPEHDSARIDVDRTIDRATGDLLGSEIGRLPAKERVLFRPTRAGDSEVEDAGETVQADDHILRGDVTMHHARKPQGVVVRAMCVIEAEKQVVDDGGRYRDRQFSPRVDDRVHNVREAGALDVLHHDVDNAAVDEHIQRGDDVGMSETRLVDDQRTKDVRVLAPDAADGDELRKPQLS